VPGSGTPDALPYDASVAASDEPESQQAQIADERPSRPTGKTTRRRSAVPAWDDIVFGARRS
jgi:hypothetical protein